VRPEYQAYSYALDLVGQQHTYFLYVNCYLLNLPVDGMVIRAISRIGNISLNMRFLTTPRPLGSWPRPYLPLEQESTGKHDINPLPNLLAHLTNQVRTHDSSIRNHNLPIHPIQIPLKLEYGFMTHISRSDERRELERTMFWVKLGVRIENGCILV
jgi:hypothetical protein